MKFTYITLSLFLLIGTSCEKVIDIDLKDASPELVIEAVIYKGENDFTVKVSRTAPYFDNTPTEKIDNAKVSLKFEGETLDIPNVGRGEYITFLNAKVNTAFLLEVEVDGKSYSATTDLIEKVAIDSVYYEYQEAFGPREAGYTVFVQFTDPAATNFYRLTHSLNGVYQNGNNDLQVMEDSKINGNKTHFPIRGKIFEVGDKIDVQFIHFDEASYDYFNSLADIINTGGGPNGGSAAPGNPLSNWSNNALGYFSAYSYDTASIIIVE
ncbi:DUF4249 domain-containing protein [Flammeovirga pectinis]|nr:DUF4249 domain-containing protein [Flammeovirga pectinis]